MYQRQVAKQGLSAAIVDNSNDQSRTFSAEELRALFEVGGCLVWKPNSAGILVLVACRSGHVAQQAFTHVCGSGGRVLVLNGL